MGKNGNPEIISGIGPGHNWQEQTRKNPTCTEDGYISYKCQNHAETHIDVLNALGHDLFSVTVDATCEKDGSITTTCSRCDYWDATVLPALGHDLSSVTVTAACVVEGSITTTCSRCDYVTVTVLPALGHDFNTLIEHKDATCTVKGYDLYKCSRCSATNTIDIQAIGHAWNKVIVEPTCTKQGYNLHVCANDATHNYKTNYVHSLGHDFTILLKHKDANCDNNGYDLFKCSRCKTTKTTQIPATGHAWSETIIDPTCTTEGYTIHVCANDATHNYNDNPIKALDHDFYLLIKHQDATCENTGYNLFKCSRCDQTHQTTIPTLHHNWGEWIVTKEPTCEQEGQETQTCTNNPTTPKPATLQNSTATP